VPTSASPPFAQFSRRITQGYVILAVLLIVLVALSSTIVSFVNYATSYNQTLDAATARIQQRVELYQSKHQTLAQYGPTLVQDESRSRYRLLVFDSNHKLIAGDMQAPDSTTLALAALFGMRTRHIHVPDGSIALQPDFEAFSRYVERYWLIIVPIGIIAVLLAWLAGRAITRRAVRPLEDVTDALKAIAAGDFTPKLLLESDSGLHALTQAYNEVAQRLNVATMDQRRQKAEMRQFIADAGHELRTPLTIFMGYLDALRSGVVQDSSAVSRVHETMLDESRKMRTIIEKLILLARMEREEPPVRERIDLNSVTARAVDALRPLAGDRIVFSHDGGAAITGDDSELYEAVKNVVENAVRYAPGKPVEVRVGRAGDEATIEVLDRGPGMQTIDVEHAFDRFYRGSMHGDIEGSGLGLAIAKRAVERMGGAIALESRVNEGTRVTMRFPVS
jgi:two-component system OmpR family sensor kinase